MANEPQIRSGDDTLREAPPCADHGIGEIAVEWGILTAEELAACVEEARSLAAPAAGEATLGPILLRRRLVDGTTLARLLTEDAERRLGLPKLDRYRIEARLGEGATAVVYRAHDRTLDRPVAIKILKEARLASARTRARFLAEARALARVSHPNLVAVHDAGEERGQAYLVMDLVQGSRFSDALPRDPSSHPSRESCRLAASILEKVARAVHHAHEAGIVHRDLKPGNIVLDAVGEPRVIDFGLARMLDRETAITRPGTTLGTPLYMAPEQVRGDVVGPAADVYAIGVMLYESAAGRPPLDAESSVELYHRILHEEPPSLSSVNSEVDRAFEIIVSKALEKEPARRYASALALAEDLSRYLAGESIRARPSSTVERILRQTRRARPALGLAALACAAALLTGIWMARPSGDELDRAADERARAETRERAYLELDREREILNTAIPHLYRSDSDYGEFLGRVQASRERIERIAHEVPDFDLVLEQVPRDAETLFQRGIVLAIALGEVDRGLADIELALEVAPAEWPSRAKVEALRTTILRERGKR